LRLLQNAAATLVRVVINAFPLAGRFTETDNVVLENLGSYTGIALRNAQAYELSRTNERKISSLLGM